MEKLSKEEWKQIAEETYKIKQIYLMKLIRTLRPLPTDVWHEKLIDTMVVFESLVSDLEYIARLEGSDVDFNMGVKDE